MTASWHEGRFDVSFAVPVGSTFELYAEDVFQALNQPLWIEKEFGTSPSIVSDLEHGERCQTCSDGKASVHCLGGLMCYNYAEAVIAENRPNDYFENIPGCVGTPPANRFTAGSGYCVRPRDTDPTLGQSGSANSGYFAYPPRVLQSGTTYRGDTLLQGMERYDAIRFNRFSGTSGYTEFNPHDGQGWLAYEPEYALLNRRLRAKYSDGQSSLVRVQFSGSYPSGISEARLITNQIHTTHMKMPWNNLVITWAVPKGSNVARPQGHHSGFTAYPAGDYSPDGTTTFDFQTLFANVLGLESSCEAVVQKYDLYIRSYGWALYQRGESLQFYQTAGWGNYVKISTDDRPCGGKTYLEASNAQIKRASVDMKDVQAPNNGFTHIRAEPQDATKTILVMIYDTILQNVFLVKGSTPFILTYGSTYDFTFFLLEKECENYRHAGSRVTDWNSPQGGIECKASCTEGANGCVRYGSEGLYESMVLSANGYLAYASGGDYPTKSLYEISFANVLVTDALTLPPSPPPPPWTPGGAPPPVPHSPPPPPPKPPSGGIPGMFAEISLTDYDANFYGGVVTIDVFADTGTDDLSSWAFALYVDDIYENGMKDTATNRPTVETPLWSWGVESYSYNPNMYVSTMGGTERYAGYTRVALINTASPLDAPFGDRVHLVTLRFEVEPSERYNFGIMNGEVNGMVNSGNRQYVGTGEPMVFKNNIQATAFGINSYTIAGQTTV